eukprot:m51a1_g5647 hypothetical protein (247) ;mRNA; r:860993-861865
MAEAAETKEERQERLEEERRANIVKPISASELAEFNAAQEQCGVVYLSRIPTGMNPTILRQFMEPYGKTLRIYLVPEDEAHVKARKKAGGDGRRKFLEGWVEFADKRKARLAAMTLNGTEIQGARRAPYAQEIWTIKYLPKFKWFHLTERLAYEQAQRQQRLKVAISRVKEDNETFMEQVASSQAFKRRQERRESKKKDVEEKKKAGESLLGEKPRKAKRQAGGEEHSAAPAKKRAKKPALAFDEK